MLNIQHFRNQADIFAHRWNGETDEDGEAKTFMDEFFRIFGLDRHSLAKFEYATRLGSRRNCQCFFAVKSFNRRVAPLATPNLAAVAARSASRDRDLRPACVLPMVFSPGPLKVSVVPRLPRRRKRKNGARGCGRIIVREQSNEDLAREKPAARCEPRDVVRPAHQTQARGVIERSSDAIRRRGAKTRAITVK